MRKRFVRRAPLLGALLVGAFGWSTAYPPSIARAAEAVALAQVDSRGTLAAGANVQTVIVQRDEPARLTLGITYSGMPGLRLGGKVLVLGPGGEGHIAPVESVLLEEGAGRTATLVFERTPDGPRGRVESLSLVLAAVDPAGTGRQLVNTYRIDKVWSEPEAGAVRAADGTIADVLLDPAPLGDTPVAAKPGPTPPPTPTPPTPTPTPPGPGPGPVGGVRTRIPRDVLIRERGLILAVLPKLDLYQTAKAATWRNATAEIPFGTGNEKGSAVALEKSTLGDGKEYRFLLNTHPQWINHGRMSGIYKLTIPADAASFSVGMGFINGAKASDGATFDVLVTEPSGRAGVANKWTTLVRETVRQDQVVQRTVPLPDSVKGKPVELWLTVNAGASSAQDWAVWVHPRIQ